MLYSSSLKYSDWRKISSGILRIYLEEANFQFVRARLLVYMIHALWPWTVMTIIPIHCWSITPVDTITTNKIDMHAIIIIGRYSKSNRVIASSPTQWYRECFCSKWINNAISAIYLQVSYIFISTCTICWTYMAFTVWGNIITVQVSNSNNIQSISTSSCNNCTT